MVGAAPSGHNCNAAHVHGCRKHCATGPPQGPSLPELEYVAEDAPDSRSDHHHHNGIVKVEARDVLGQQVQHIVERHVRVEAPPDCSQGIHDPIEGRLGLPASRRSCH